MSFVRVTEATRDKLNVLKGVFGKKNVSEVIVSLMESRGFDDSFFERLKGLI